MTRDFTADKIGRLTLVHTGDDSYALLSAALESVFTQQDSALAEIDGCHYSLEAGVFRIGLATLQQEVVFVLDELQVTEDENAPPEKANVAGILLYLFTIPADPQNDTDRSTWHLDTCLHWLRDSGKPFILLMMQAQRLLPDQLTRTQWSKTLQQLYNGMMAGELAFDTATKTSPATVPGSTTPDAATAPAATASAATAAILLDSYCRIINRHFTGHEQDIPQKIGLLSLDPATATIRFGLDALVLRLLLSMLQTAPRNRYTVLDTSTKNVYTYV